MPMPRSFTLDQTALLPMPADAVTIWQPPQSGTRYTIGVDAATGAGRDYTSILVFSNRVPFEQVAWYHSRAVNTVIGSQIMVDLGEWYNAALLVIESRFPGNAYIDNALEVHHYPNLYQHERHLDESADLSRKFGYMTGGREQEKRLLINDMLRLLMDSRGPQIVFHDKFTVEAMCNFVYLTDKTQTGAPAGMIDDPVIASMLAVHGCMQNPQEPLIRHRPTAPDENLAHKRYLEQEMERKWQEQNENLALV